MTTLTHPRNRRGSQIVGLLLILCAGCVTKQPRMVSVIVPHPVTPYRVMVPVYKGPTITAIQPTTFGVAWNASPANVPDGSLAYEVQVSNDLTTWVSYQTTELQFTLPKDSASKFFRVRAVNSAGATSEWATTR